MDAKEYIQQWDKLKADRATWEQTWQKISDYVSPTPRDITGSSSTGGRKKAVVLDTTATDVAVQLAHALNGAFTNPASEWFRITVDDYDLSNDSEARQWLETVGTIANHYLRQSNFSEAMIEAYMDLIMYGTTGLLIEEDDEDGCYFSARNIGEFVAIENHKGRIDKVLRKANMTARQAVMRWGNKVTKGIKKQYDTDPHKPVNILHVIEPRDERNPEKIDKKNKPIRSLWLDMDSAEIIEESGYDEMPFIVSRWAKNAGQVYGYSPAMGCLNAILSLNLIEKTSLEAKQLAAMPPVIIDDDSLLSQFQWKPGMPIYKRARANAPQPLNTNAQPGAADSAAEDRRQLIRRAFFSDVIQSQELRYVTAEGIRQSADERERILTSTLGRLQSEKLEPLVNRVFGILARKDRFPPPPESLQGRNWRPVWTSPLARRQDERAADSIMKAGSLIGQLSQLFAAPNPLLERFDYDELSKIIANIYGVPRNIIKSDAVLKKERQQAKEAMQAQAQQQQMMDMMSQGATIESQTANTGGPINKIMKGLNEAL